jgi:hypothetical protein
VKGLSKSLLNPEDRHWRQCVVGIEGEDSLTQLLIHSFKIAVLSSGNIILTLADNNIWISWSSPSEEGIWCYRKQIDSQCNARYRGKCCEKKHRG